MPFLPAGVGAAIAGGVASAAVGVAGNAIIGGLKGDKISEGQAQANARSEAALAEGRKLYDPYIAGGTNALTAYGDFAGLNGQEASDKARSMFTASPGYDYQVKEGLRAVDNGAAARGMLRSGATLKAEQTLGSNLANQDFTAYLGRLNTLAGFGEKAVGGYTNLLGGQANQQQATDVSAAREQASTIDATGKGITSTVGGVLGDKSVQNALTGLFTPSGSGTSGDMAISNPTVLGGSYFSNSNPNLNWAV